MREISTLQCRYFVVGVLAVLSVGVIPTLGDSLSKHYGFVNQQDFYSILKSIESKLGNIDQVLIRQTNYNIRDDLTAIHRRLNTLDDKITHLQSTNAKCLENIHEEVKQNMVSVKSAIQKDVKDILSKTTEERQDSDNVILKLEKIEDELTSRDEETKTELSDIIALLEDLRTPCSTKDSYSDIDNTETTTNPQDNRYNETCKVTPEELEEIRQDVYSQNEFANWTTNFLLTMKNDLQQDMNNYANKVADMNLENWESNKLLGEKIKSLQKFMVQMSRRLQRNSTNESPATNELDEITRHMNSNFEKILSTQNLFLESCYKLQNDDSQIEFKLGKLLHVLVEKLEEKVIIGTERIENIALLIMDHNDFMKHHIFTKSYYHDDAVSGHENNRKARNSLDTKTLSTTTDDIPPPFLPYANLKGFLQDSRDNNYATFTQSKLIEAHIIETQQNWLTPQRNNLNKLKESKTASTREITKSIPDIETWDQTENSDYNLGSSQNVNEVMSTHKMGQDKNNKDKDMNTKTFITNNKTVYGKYNMNGTIASENVNKGEDIKDNATIINELMALIQNSTHDYTEEHGDMNTKNTIYDIVTDSINEDQYEQTTPGNSIGDSILFYSTRNEDAHFNMSTDDNYATEKPTSKP